MPASVELVRVPRERIRPIWPFVVDMIHSAVRRTGLNHTDDIDADVRDGNGLLWLAIVDGKIAAAAATSLILTNREKVCILTACGGAGVALWLPLIAGIEAYARAEGCACMRIYGRKGWAAILDGYQLEHLILRKDL